MSVEQLPLIPGIAPEQPDERQWSEGVPVSKNGNRLANPMIPRHGKGPQDRRCKHCAFISCYEAANRYYKCKKRGISGGTATDHRLNWPTCALFEEARP